MKPLLYTFFVLAWLLSPSFPVSGQGVWTVPAAEAAKKSPVPSSEKSIAAGKGLYNTHCKSCHGDPGKGNGLPLVPKPQDITSDQFQKNSDGSLFYKISNGKGAMPRFKDVIKENDKWNIIHYIRSFKKGKTASVETSVPEQQLKTFEGNVELAIRMVDSAHLIIVKAENAEGNDRKPIEGLGITVFAKRYFRDLILNENDLITDASGEVSLTFPTDLPGDSMGNVMVIAKVTAGISDTVLATAQVAWGKPFVFKNPRSERSLWNSTWMAPWWLLLSYFGVVLGVWGTIFYIVVEVGKIKRIGQEASVS